MESPSPKPSTSLPNWAYELINLYESGAQNQFVLYGNVYDRMVLPLATGPELGSLDSFLLRVLLPGFDVILSYDLGNGVRVEKGGPVFTQWPHFKESPQLPTAPRAAIEMLTQYFRYCANLAVLQGTRTRVGCLIKSANLVAPSLPGGLNYDLNALALLMRDWASDSLLTSHDLATFLITENLSELHPLIANNPRTATVKIPLPGPTDLGEALQWMLPNCGHVLSDFENNLGTVAEDLSGATLSAVETLVKTRFHSGQKLDAAECMRQKKAMVEKDCSGLIEFIQSSRSLNDYSTQDTIKQWLRQDLALWRSDDLQAMPMGYLICGPVGTGKTYLVECLAGEAGVPVVKLNNFRDRWVGSTEGNLEKIFRLLHALGRCYVFVDEADQALGRRQGGTDDSGLSGRVYSMVAAEMSNSDNRGKIVWILASSRPDLIEVDLKRPGRMDLKIPIFPATTPAEGFQLIQAMCAKRQLTVPDSLLETLSALVPDLLTAGAADTIATRVYRRCRLEARTSAESLTDCLTDYQSPVAREVMDFQIQLAVQEASDREFIPPALRAGHSG